MGRHSCTGTPARAWMRWNSRKRRATWTTWCPSTSSTKTRRLRKRVSSTRRKVSTTWSRRRPKETLSISARKSVRSQSSSSMSEGSSLHALVFHSKACFQEPKLSGLPCDFVMYVSVHLFLQIVQYGGQSRLLEKRFREYVPGKPICCRYAVDYVIGWPFLPLTFSGTKLEIP